MKILQGIVPPVITPLTEKGDIDQVGLAKLLKHLKDGGVHGLFILGTTGEGPALGMERQKRMIQETLRLNDGALPVLVGISAAALEDSFALADFAWRQGADALVCAPPCYFQPGEDELMDYYRTVSANVRLPLFLYNMPSMTKVLMKPALVLRLAELPNVRGYKDSSGNMCDLHEVLLGLKGRDDFSVFVGPEELLAEAVLFGADGGVAGGANLNPELFVAMYNAARAADVPNMRRLQRDIYSQRRLYSIGRYQSSIIKGIKSALSLKGICQDTMAMPFHHFLSPERTKVDRVLRQLPAAGDGEAPADAASRSDGRVFPVGQVDGIPYFMPPVGFDEGRELRRLHAMHDANADDLAAVQGLPMRITASFIYAHPADYHGRPMLHAAVQEWRDVFRRFRALHMDTVIFQSALWRELGDCYYQSSRFARELQCHGVIECMLEAAAAEGLHVFLGGYGSVAGWKDRLSPAELQSEINEHRACFGELVRLGRFDGMYFPAETAFEGRRRPELEQRMRTLYTAFADMVKEQDGRLRVIASPATFHRPAQNDAFQDFWNTVLDGSGIDILMPQDCIGNGIARIREMPAIWQAWKAIASHHGLDLWSHTEIFERRGYTPECNLFPAAPARVAAQLAQVAPFVQKACCWEALHFADPDASPEAARLMQFLQSL
jgi:4-hydroxy-tetrahydrodipicolinate synthase